jgi:hypothetical protein
MLLLKAETECEIEQRIEAIFERCDLAADITDDAAKPL